MITVGDVINLASIMRVGQSLGASIDEIKAELPAITQQALEIEAEVSKLKSLQSMPQLSQSLTVDLSIPHDKTPYDISGGQLQAIDIDGDLDVRFNQSDSEAYNINKLRRIKVPFDKIFLTNTAQPGKSAKLIYGNAGYFEVQDVSPMEINIIASEVTLNMVITSSTIMMPIDIQSSYIMMPVDIQAQYLNLAIDVVAQSIGYIQMDIAAQTVGKIGISLNVADIVGSIPIDIKAQSVGNIKMDLAAQSIGNVAIDIAGQIENVDISLVAQNIAIKSQAEWSPQAGQQKYFYGSGTVAAPGLANADYSVPTGKTLYITHFSFSCGATTQADRDLAQNGKAVLYNYSTSTWLVFLGGNGGDGLPFPTPIKFTSGQVVRMTMQNVANHSMDMCANWGGYEL